MLRISAKFRRGELTNDSQLQVWFQNRRSKERRMKQLSALGARRHFFRSPRRMRALRGDLDDAEMMGPGFGYYNGEF